MGLFVDQIVISVYLEGGDSGLISLSNVRAQA